MIYAALLQLNADALDAQVVWDKMRQAVVPYVSATGTMMVTDAEGTEVHSFKLLRPHYLLIESDKSVLFNYERNWHLYDPPTRRLFIEKKVTPTYHVATGVLFGLQPVLDPKYRGLAEPGSAKRITFRGKSAIQVDQKHNDYYDSIDITFLMDAKTFRPLGFKQTDRKGKVTFQGYYSDLKLGAKLSPSDFNWKPPKEAKLQK